jgi:hypothetical protein
MSTTRDICMYHICISIFMKNCLLLYNSSHFARHYISTKFFLKHCIKRVLDTETNGYYCFSFTERLSYIQRVYPKQRIKRCQIFTLTYHLTFPTGCACLFMGFANRSQGKCTLPHPSPIPIPPSTNLPMLGLRYMVCIHLT